VADAVIFGNGRMTEVAHFYLTHDSPHRAVAFTVDADCVGTGVFHALPVVAFDDIEQRFPPRTCSMFLPIRYSGVNALRKARCQAAGALILEDTEPCGVYLGAASARRNAPGDKLNRI